MKRLLLLLSFCTCIFTISCKKNSSNEPNPKKPSDTSSIVIQDNVHVIDSTKYKLNTDNSLLSKGTYQYTGSINNLNYKVNDIIVGQTGDGYIRKITSITKNGSSINLNTVQANMTEVFKNADIVFSTPTNNLAPTNLKTNFSNLKLKTNDISGTLFSKASLSVTGQISFNPNWTDSISYHNGVLHYLALGCQNAQLTGDLILSINGKAGAEIKGEDVIYQKSSYTVKFVGPVPVVLKTTYSIKARYDMEIQQNISRQVNITSVTTASLGITYAEGDWSYIHDLNPNTDVTASNFNKNTTLSVKFALIPEVSFAFYGIGGPYADLGLNGSLEGTIAEPSLDWDFDAEGWLELEIGAKASILGYPASYSKTFSTNHITYKTPVAMSIFSGNKQSGSPNKKLLEPIKALITDSRGKPQPYVPVYFKVITGGGGVDSSKVFSDKNGIAQTSWKLGQSLDSQKVEARAMTGSGKLLQSAPLTFVANVKLHIGDRAFGGIVFYLDKTEKHGLVVDSLDLGKINLENNLFTSHRELYIDSVGSGPFNTSNIITDNNKDKSIALLCTNYKGGGYKDWFLPSQGELNLLYKAKSKIPGVSMNTYWSSTSVAPPDIPASVAFYLVAIDLNNGERVGPYFIGSQYAPYNPSAPGISAYIRAARFF